MNTPPMQPVRFGKKSDEQKTRFEQTNEDRMNENFRRLYEAVDALQAEIERLRNGE